MMRSFFKMMLVILTLGTIFFVGFHFGKEKVKDKIPKFQEEGEISI